MSRSGRTGRAGRTRGARRRNPLARGLRVLVGLVVLLLAPSAWTVVTWAGHHAEPDTVEPAPVALVFGAAVWDGEPSPYLAGRLDVALQLWDSGAASAILVSGDNRMTDYDEPGAMERYLVARGVPKAAIVKDPAGTTTFNSCRRAREVYGVTRLIAVTQDYHLPRAITACRALGIDAVGVGDATARQFGSTWWWGVAREVPANWKLVVDLVRPRPPAPDTYDTSVDEAIAHGR